MTSSNMSPFFLMKQRLGSFPPSLSNLQSCSTIAQETQQTEGSISGKQLCLELDAHADLLGIHQSFHSGFKLLPFLGDEVQCITITDGLSRETHRESRSLFTICPSVRLMLLTMQCPGASTSRPSEISSHKSHHQHRKESIRLRTPTSSETCWKYRELCGAL